MILRKYFLALPLVFLLIPFSMLLSQSEEGTNIFENYKQGVVTFTVYGEEDKEIGQGSGFLIGEKILATSYGLVSNAKEAEGLDTLPVESGGPLLAGAVRAMNAVILAGRRCKLTRSQYIMFLMADMMTWAEVGDALCRKAAAYEGGQGRSVDFIRACGRLFAREAVVKVHTNGLKIIHGSGEDIDEGLEDFTALNMGRAMQGNTGDMDMAARELVN